MQNIIYSKHTWEDNRNYYRKVMLRYTHFNARTKEPGFRLFDEVLSMKSIIEYDVMEKLD